MYRRDSVAVALVMGFAVLGWAASSGSAMIITPPDDFQLTHEAEDVYNRDDGLTNTKNSWSWTIDKYGGSGCEPMLDMNARLKRESGLNDKILQLYSEFSWHHWVDCRAPSVFPEGFNKETDLVPLTWHVAVEGHTDGAGQFYDVRSTFLGEGYKSWTERPRDIEFAQEYKGARLWRSAETTTLTAGIELTVSASCLESEARIVVDPYVQIDPGYIWKDYFVVYNSAHPDIGTYVPVNRDWQQQSSVPEPASCLLLACAVGGMGIALKRRRKT